MTSLRVTVPERRDVIEVRPTLDELRDRRPAGRQVPLVHTYIADCETPVSAFLKLRTDGPCFLLESAEEGQRLGRYSMIGIEPHGVIHGRDGELEIIHADGRVEALDASDPFGAVEDAVQRLQMTEPWQELAFAGGAVGYFGYDLVRTVERLPDVPADDRDLPDLLMMITGPVVQFDHVRRSLTIVMPCSLEGDLDAAYADAVAAIERIVATLAGPVPDQAPREAPRVGDVTSNTTEQAFCDAVEHVREYVFAGDAFQVVPSQRFGVRHNLDPFAIYRGLRAANPSPYMFFLQFDECSLVGSSPEMLVKVSEGNVETRPIAGTRPRGETLAEDRELSEELLADPKERAEHVMLVDLGRNDVGRVCEPGTVRVKELMGVHLYSHVMHIESSVIGRLAAGRRAADALRATFPAGTLSGAPKVRAMEIIDELEPTKRGPYGGAVGYLGYNGDLDTCITIRTIVCAGDMAYVQAGAGVVADSVPATEFAETENKAAGMFRAIEVAAGQHDW
jgi:anthranilate synthase component 1